MPFGFISSSFNLSKKVNEPDKIAYYANFMFFCKQTVYTKKKNWSKTVVKRKNRKKLKAVIRKKFIKSFNCRLLKLATNNYNRTKPATESNSAKFVSTWDYPSDNPYPPHPSNYQIYRLMTDGRTDTRTNRWNGPTL